MSLNFKKNHLKSDVSTIFKNCIKTFEQLIYPLKCLKCGNYINPNLVEPDSMDSCFCDSCLKAGLYPIDAPYCIKCGMKFKKTFYHDNSQDHDDSQNQDSNQDQNANHVCQTCIKTPLIVEKVRAVFDYRGIIKDAIPLYKYSSKLALAKVFELLLFQTFVKYYGKSDIDLIIPMPLHKNRLRERGFNQAFLIIRNFMTLYQIQFKAKPFWEINTTSLVRIKKTNPQTGFNIEQRKNNLKNAFKVVEPDKIKNKNILLIDDVFTTGATNNEAAFELLKNNAKRVEALVVART